MGKRTTYTAKQFISAIPGTGGIVSAIAKRVGCEWHTADNWIQNTPTVQQAYKDETEAVADMAESVVVKSAQGGNTTDAKWLLERLRKDRFSTRKEFVVDPGQLVKMSDDELKRVAVRFGIID